MRVSALKGPVAEVVPERKVWGRCEIFVVSPNRKENTDGHGQAGREIVFEGRLNSDQVEVGWQGIDWKTVHRKR